MKNKIKDISIPLVIIELMIASSFVGTSLAHNNYAQFDYNRNYQFEQYCDSIWNNNPEYYQNVLVETDYYQQYINKCGEWWDD